MADIFTLSATDLAALLCSRVCHDIISPVGAINNGLELLDEGGADEDAMNLIRASARNASARLQFARIAFGAAGSAGMVIDTGDAQNRRNRLSTKREAGIRMDGRALAPAQEQRQAAAQSYSGRQRRPSRAAARSASRWTAATANPKFTISSRGPMLRVPPKFLELHSGNRPDEAIDAHAVQPYYTLLLAGIGMEISIHATAEEIVFLPRAGIVGAVKLTKCLPKPFSVNLPD